MKNYALFTLCNSGNEETLYTLKNGVKITRGREDGELFVYSCVHSAF